MRAMWAFLVLCLVPLAAAQAPSVTLAELQVAPFEALAQPLQAPARTTFTLRLSCLALEPQGTPVQYSIADKPAWANVTVSPSTDLMEPIDCQSSPDAWVTLTGEVTVSVNEQAPAFEPADIVLRAATATPGPRQAQAEARAALTPSYYSITEVILDEAIQTVAPGATARFPMTLRNFGNGPTEMRFALESQTGPIDVELPPTMVLESRYGGNASNAADIEVLVHAHELDGFVNQVSVVNLRLFSAYAKDPSLKGDESSVSLLVTVRSEGVAKLAAVPMSPLLAMLAVGLAAWAFRR